MAIFTKNMRKHIFVHPKDTDNLLSAVKTTLLKDKRKFSDRLEGALLDVKNLKLVNDRYLVVDGFLSMEVQADFDVFSPSVGMELEGVVNRVSKSHMGCIVMDLFNASLSASDSSDVEAHVGDTCSFVITQVIVDGEILFLRGNLISVTKSEVPAATSDTNVDVGDKNSSNETSCTNQNGQVINASGKKSRKSLTKIKTEKKSSDVIASEKTTMSVASGDSGKSEKEKKRKRKHQEVNEEIATGILVKQEVVEEESLESPPGKKRKSHKSLSPKKSKRHKTECQE